MKKFMLGLQAALLLLATAPVYAEKVHIKYRDDDVDVGKFACSDVTEGKEVRRVCYDKANGYLVMKLQSTYYHYCGIDEGTVNGLLNSASKDDFYHASIKGSFDCRSHPAPKY